MEDANGNSLLGNGPLPAATVTPNAVPAPAGLIAAGVLFARLRHAQTPADNAPTGAAA